MDYRKYKNEDFSISCYLVRPIYFLHPYIFLVEILERRETVGSNGDPLMWLPPGTIIQAGLRGALPTKCSMDSEGGFCVKRSSMDFQPGASRTAMQLMKEAHEIYFVPLKCAKYYAARENVQCIFGDVYIYNKEVGKVQRLLKLLCQAGLAYRSCSIFDKKLYKQELFEPIGESRIALLKRSIENYKMSEKTRLINVGLKNLIRSGEVSIDVLKAKEDDLRFAFECYQKDFDAPSFKLMNEKIKERRALKSPGVNKEQNAASQQKSPGNLERSSDESKKTITRIVPAGMTIKNEDFSPQNNTSKSKPCNNKLTNRVIKAFNKSNSTTLSSRPDVNEFDDDSFLSPSSSSSFVGPNISPIPSGLNDGQDSEDGRKALSHRRNNYLKQESSNTDSDNWPERDIDHPKKGNKVVYCREDMKSKNTSYLSGDIRKKTHHSNFKSTPACNEATSSDDSKSFKQKYVNKVRMNYGMERDNTKQSNNSRFVHSDYFSKDQSDNACNFLAEKSSQSSSDDIVKAVNEVSVDRVQKIPTPNFTTKDEDSSAFQMPDSTAKSKIIIKSPWDFVNALREKATKKDVEKSMLPTKTLCGEDMKGSEKSVDNSVALNGIQGNIDGLEKLESERLDESFLQSDESRQAICNSTLEETVDRVTGDITSDDDPQLSTDLSETHIDNLSVIRQIVPKSNIASKFGWSSDRLTGLNVLASAIDGRFVRADSRSGNESDCSMNHSFNLNKSASLSGHNVSSSFKKQTQNDVDIEGDECIEKLSQLQLGEVKESVKEESENIDHVQCEDKTMPNESVDLGEQKPCDIANINEQSEPLIDDNLTKLHIEEPNIKMTMLLVSETERPLLPSIPKEDSSNVFGSITGQSQPQIINRIITPKLMIHTKSLPPPEPQLKFSNIDIAPEIAINLSRMNVKVLKNLQTHVLPAALEGRSLSVVSPANSGKTRAIMITVCSKLMTLDNNDKLPKGFGPAVLIVCPTVKAAAIAASDCHRFMSGIDIHNKKVVILRTEQSDSEIDDTQQILQGVDILISSPTFLKKHLNYDTPIIDFERLLFLVLEEADVLDEKFKTEIAFILGKCQKATRNRPEHLDLQVLTMSQRWCGLLHDISNTLKEPAVFISAHQECAVYSKTPLHLDFVLAEQKLDHLVEMLAIDEPVKKKTVIVCKEDSEITQAYEKLLSELCKDVVKFDSSMHVGEIAELSKSLQIWKRCSDLIIICNDVNLPQLDILDANWLIHYSFPRTVSMFNERFSLLTQNYPNILRPDEASANMAKVNIFVDELNSEQLPTILNFVSRFEAEIPDEVKIVKSEILKLKDLKKAEQLVELCNELAAFGQCANTWSCHKRHSVYNPTDKPKSWIPKTGVVKFEVLYIHNAAYWSVRVLEYITLKGNTVKVAQTYMNLAITMFKYFAQEENQKAHGAPEIGDICAVSLKSNCYERCQVVKIVEVSSLGETKVVLVNLLDQEVQVEAKTGELYFLPEHFKAIINPVVRMRLANVVPNNQDIVWPKAVNEEVEDMLKNMPHEDMYARGNIILGLGNTLWLETVQCCQDLPSLGVVVVRSNLKDHLRKKNMIKDNPKHLEILYDLCKTCNFDLPDFKETFAKVVPKIVLPEPQWAFLPEGFNMVYFSAAHNPGCFFIRLLKHQSVLDHLTKDIQKYVADLKYKMENKGLNYDVGNTFYNMPYESGTYCIAMFPDDHVHNRARIDEVEDLQPEAPIPNSFSNLKDRFRYKCFFVDHGETMFVAHANIHPINRQLILQMPFQAIECKLFGLKQDKWTDAATDTLYDMAFEKDSIDLKRLVAKYYTKENGVVTSGNKYGLTLFHYNLTDDLITFNEDLVKNNFAIFEESDFQLIENDRKASRDFILALDKLNRCEESELSDEEAKIPDCISGRKPENEFSESGEYDSDTSSIDFQFGPEICRSFAEAAGRHDLADAIKDAMTPHKEAIQDKESPTLSEYVMVLNTPALKNTYRTPKVLWYQNDKFVILKILIVGVEKCSLEIKIQSVNFETVLHGEEYKLSLQLTGGVRVDESKYTIKGQHVLVELRKLVATDWHYLIEGDLRPKWLVYDADFVDLMDEEDDEPQRVFVPEFCYDQEARLSDENWVRENWEHEERALRTSKRSSPDFVMCDTEDDDNLCEDLN